jgi:uncharacterized membrane protein
VRAYLLLVPIAVSAVVAAVVLGTGTALWNVLVICVLSIPLGLSVWALLDMARRPQWVWAMSGRSQALWMVGVLFGVLLVVVGLLISLLYLLNVRSDLRRIEAGDLPSW